MYPQIRNISIACILLVALGGFFQAASADTEANKAIVERRVEFWNTGGLAIADEIFAADFLSHVPHYPNVTDIESYRAEVANSRTAFPDFHAEIHEMVAEGNKVVCRFTNRYTAPNGNQVTATGITIDHFADGKIVEEWWSVDVLGVMEQFGMMPPTRGDYTWGEPSAATGDPGDPETNKAIVQRMIDEAMNQQNLDVIDEVFAAVYLMHDPAWPMEVKGPEGFKQWSGMMLEPYFSDSHISADLIAEGDTVAVRWTWSGTHTGEFMGIPPTGRQIAITGISIHRFANGEFVESWVSYDTLGMIQQLTAEEWPAQGVWVTSVPTPLGNMIIKSTWMAQHDAKTRFTGEFEQMNTYPVLIDVYPDLEEIKYGGGLMVKIGLNKYEATFLQYFTKTSGPSLEEIVGIGIVTGTFELVGPDLAQGQGAGAYYMAAQDADQDGLPDEGQEPVVCVPWEWTAKRLTIMPGCVPTLIPE
ncbi:MAG: ester cyclase [Planctomycetes bacterium]|nr:ester cyclase [Planctomycetota bacterium]MBL7189702.1 ester cyclase [Phycisphaerae bacterium]